MSAGITRVHGTAIVPSQRPSTISFYTATFPSMDIHTSEVGVVNGVFDQLFRTAVDNFATVAMIGTPVYASSNTTIRFAIEDTGADANSPSYLGTGPTDASPASTALALQAAVRALGATVGPNSVDCTGVTVTTFAL